MSTTRSLVRSLLEQGHDPADPAFLAVLRAERLKEASEAQAAPLLTATPTSNQQ